MSNLNAETEKLKETLESAKDMSGIDSKTANYVKPGSSISNNKYGLSHRTEIRVYFPGSLVNFS